MKMLKMLYITMVLFLHCQLLKLLNLKVIFLLDNLIRLHAGQRRFKQLSLFIWATNWEFNWIQNLQKCGFYDTDTDNTCFRVLSASLKIPMERHNPVLSVTEFCKDPFTATISSTNLYYSLQSVYIYLRWRIHNNVITDVITQVFNIIEYLILFGGAHFSQNCMHLITLNYYFVWKLKVRSNFEIKIILIKRIFKFIIYIYP